jgi:competence protein ComEA
MFRPIFHTVRSLLSLVFVAAVFASAACTKRELTEHLPNANTPSVSHHPININTADQARLESLPDVGSALAERIAQHRARYGPFRRPEHLMLIEGISEKRFLKLRPFVTTD